MKLVAYCRTSTANGAGQDSLGAQADACAGWAAAYGHEIVEVETVIERHDRYAVVRKLEPSGAVAKETDPRA